MASLPKLSTSFATLLTAVLLLGYGVAEAAGSYYRWRDADGKLVVSDRPPSDQSLSYEVVNTGSPMVRRVPPGQGAVPPEITPRPGNDFDPVDAQAESDGVQKNPESCARARANLDTLESAARIRLRDEESGELRFISDEERETQRQKALDIIRVHCEGGS